MIGLIVAFGAFLVLLESDPGRTAKKAESLPCYPDTVEVIQQQILEADTTFTANGIPVVTYRVILCVPEGVEVEP